MIDQDICSSSNLPRMDVGSMLMKDRTANTRSKDLKSSNNMGLGSFGKVLELIVGDKECPSPVSTYLRKVPSVELIERKTNFLQEYDTEILQVDSCSHDDSIGSNHDGKPHFDQVREQDGKFTATASPMKAKESPQIEETVMDLFDESKSYSFTSTDISSNRLDNIEGASYDVKWETGDISIGGHENKVVINQQTVPKQIGEAVEEPVYEGTTSARSSFSLLIHDETSFPGVASLSGAIITSGHIQYSGNISHRSDSSTTSTHSFAFPILQPEWNSSPVKMAKPDRRRFRKHRWRTVLVCCKF